MLTTVGDFRARIGDNPQRLISELQAETGRYGSAEADAWKQSLGKLADVFRAPSFQPLHLFFGSRGAVAVEYQLPASSAWCDVVLLGAYNQRPAAVMIELKDWTTRSDLPGRYEGLIERHGAQELHPSDQVRGYAQYCERFHSAVADCNASVHGCVLFTRDWWYESYAERPNDRLAEAFPLFSVSPDDVERRFPEFLGNRLTRPDAAFASAFAAGGYRQDRGFVAQIGSQILDPSSSAFELLDNQRKAFAMCQSALERAFGRPRARRVPKHVVIVEGPPGSGKSVIAAKLWASLVTNPTLPSGDIVFTTTSMSQNKNWMSLFDRASGLHAARGVVRKATAYTPITTQRLGALRERIGPAFASDVLEWRTSLRKLQTRGERFQDGAKDNQNLVTIVDEAHALINPEHVAARGQFGFAVSLGPQAYHIIRSSLVSVFLLDPQQGFRQRENTSVADIAQWAWELGAGEPAIVSLAGAQFRCAGSVDYVRWVEGLLEGGSAAGLQLLARSWRQKSRTRAGGMDVRVFDNPQPWEVLLKEHVAEGSSVRLLSTYSRPWKTKEVRSPHECNADEMDFHEPYRSGKSIKYWSRIWNYVPNGDYTWFVMGDRRGLVSTNPLCEVGCPYAVRGFDYDYVGILWLDDLVWRSDHWVTNSDKVEETGFMTLIREARREKARAESGAVSAELFRRVTQAYRILFTRALKGVYIWIPDDETRAHVHESLGE